MREWFIWAARPNRPRSLSVLPVALVDSVVKWLIATPRRGIGHHVRMAATAGVDQFVTRVIGLCSRNPASCRSGWWAA